MYEFFIARRYLISKKKIRFITIITMISTIGIAVGVGALLIVLSVFNGFGNHVTTILTAFDPHIRIEPLNDSQDFDYQLIINSLSNISEITGIAPFITQKAIISSEKENIIAIIKGADEDRINQVSNVKDMTNLGEFSFKDSEETGGIILGLTLAGKLSIKIHDTVTITSTAGMEKALTQIVTPRTKKFIVRGVYDSNNKDYDKFYAFISIPSSQKLFDLKNKVNGIDIRINEIAKSEDVKTELISSLKNNYKISTWFELHEDLYSVMIVERWTAYIILSLIIIVASFTIAGSLTMTVLEKKRDIGVLKSMGSANFSIVKIFMVEGLLIGFIGTIIGCLLGYTVCFLQIKFKIFPLDPLVYAPLDAIPLDVRWVDFLYVSIAAILLSFLASLYPSLKAANQNPIDSIRWE